MLGFILACLGRQRGSGGGGGGGDYVLTDISLTGISQTVIPLRVSLVGSGDPAGALFDVYYDSPGFGSSYVLQASGLSYGDFPFDIETGFTFDKFGTLKVFGVRVVAGGTAAEATITKTKSVTVADEGS